MIFHFQHVVVFFGEKKVNLKIMSTNKLEFYNLEVFPSFEEYAVLPECTYIINVNFL